MSTEPHTEVIKPPSLYRKERYVRSKLLEKWYQKLQDQEAQRREALHRYSPPMGEPGYKKDQGKPRWDLVPWDSMLGAAKVFTHGAEKYNDRNWEEGMRYGRVYASLMRHLTDWFQGEEMDVSGLHHLDHVVANALMLSSIVKRDIYRDWDDRPVHYLGKPPKEEYYGESQERCELQD